MNEIRLNRLGDPKFIFRYEVKADGKILVFSPMTGIWPSLASAIDHARCVLGENPFCIKCKTALHEGLTYPVGSKRYECPSCGTHFNF